MSETDIVKHRADIKFNFIIADKFRNKEENFICSVNRGDIINIRSEYEESEVDHFQTRIFLFCLQITITQKEIYQEEVLKEKKLFVTYCNVNISFKEMSFPNCLGND